MFAFFVRVFGRPGQLLPSFWLREFYSLPLRPIVYPVYFAVRPRRLVV